MREREKIARTLRIANASEAIASLRAGVELGTVVLALVYYAQNEIMNGHNAGDIGALEAAEAINALLVYVETEASARPRRLRTLTEPEPTVEDALARPW